jgi:hypothetical protein
MFRDATATLSSDRSAQWFRGIILRASEGRKNGSKTAGCQINPRCFVATFFFCPLDAGLKILLTECHDRQKNSPRNQNL